VGNLRLWLSAGLTWCLLACRPAGALSPGQKVALANVAGAAAIVAWGVEYWDYDFRASPRWEEEGWFEFDTANGGADKLGHFYVAYVSSHALAGVYRYWGYERDQAIALAAWSAFGLSGFMEVTDAFSPHGFSYEDMVADALGAGLGYLLYRYPAAGRKLDFRIEFLPTYMDDKTDMMTNYHRMKHLLAVKASGFNCLADSPLRYAELHVGYYTREYQRSRRDPRYRERNRNVYVGLGLNLSRVVSDLSFTRAARLFNYYQVPYTYTSGDFGLDP
jgi:hypothetical protein